MALSLPTSYQQVIIWGLASAIFLLVPLRVVEAFMFDVVTACVVATFS